MKTIPRIYYIALVLFALVMAALIGGHTLFSPESLAGLGMLPLAIGDTDFGDLTKMLEKQGQAFEEFKGRYDNRFKTLENELNDVLKKGNRPPAGGDSRGDSPEHKKAFDQYVRQGVDSGLADLQRKAMNSGSDPDGGYFVLPEMDRTIDRIAPTVSAMYRLANVKTISKAAYEKLVKTAGMAMRRVADGSGGGETTEPKFSKVTIGVSTGEVEPWVNNETLEDAEIDLSADLADEAGIAFAEGAGAEFINGDGVAKARGILSYTNVANSSYTWGNVGYIVSGKSAAFSSVAPADTISNLVASLPVKYRQGSAFLMNDATLNTVKQMKDGTGKYYLWQPDPTAPFGGRLLGYPVEVDDNMPTIAAGSYSIAFGNFERGYTIVNRTGTTLIRDNITSKGITKFNFRRRFGGGITHFEAIKLMKFATS
ncbi:MAG: phage major capsid protein [Gallionella sp.]|jgi:HK97 family phage major capsid protein|nr:phage major capsid protein [Gallionella sp.]